MPASVSHAIMSCRFPITTLANRLIEWTNEHKSNGNTITQHKGQHYYVTIVDQNLDHRGEFGAVSKIDYNKQNPTRNDEKLCVCVFSCAFHSIPFCHVSHDGSIYTQQQSIKFK